MAQVRNIKPGHAIIHPNRVKPRCKLTRLLVVLGLLITIGLMLVVTIGGWSELQGLKPFNFLWCLLDLIVAFYVFRWSRGLLPMAAGLAILLLIIVVIAATGVAGTSWFDRNHPGYSVPQSLLGGQGLTPDVLGIVTVLMIPIELLLIVLAMVGFAQGWNLEVEVSMEEAEKRGIKPAYRGPEPSAA